MLLISNINDRYSYTNYVDVTLNLWNLQHKLNINGNTELCKKNRTCYFNKIVRIFGGNILIQ